MNVNYKMLQTSHCILSPVSPILHYRMQIHGSFEVQKLLQFNFKHLENI